MKRGIIFLAAGLILLCSAGARAFTISDLAVADNNVGNIRVSGTLAGVGAVGGLIATDMEDSFGMLKIYAWPDYVTSGQASWNSTNLNPYFRGTYTVTALPIDPIAGPGTRAQISHTVGVARAISGSLNMMQYQTGVYNPAGTWASVDTNKAKLNCIGYYHLAALGVGLVGCNMLNAAVDIGSVMNPDVIEAMFSDISAQYPLGTHFRFHANFHKKPSSFMGMGKIEHYSWQPYDEADPAGYGTMELDITSCKPWRSGAVAPLGAHVGFGPVFFDDPDMSRNFGDTLLWTTAHYSDIAPSMSASNRLGLVVSGYPGTTNYLSLFMTDELLQRWGVTDPRTQMTGYLNDVAIDAALVEFTRLAAGNELAGSAGYLFRFEFVFPAGASLMVGAANSVTAEIGTLQEHPGLPDVRINGLTSDVAVNYGDSVTLTVQLNARQYVGVGVDWWILASTPVGWYYYGNDANWHAQNNLALMQPVYQGPLFNLGSTPILSNITTLPRGAYTFYFAVSYPVSGLLDPGNPYLLYDSIGLTIR